MFNVSSLILLVLENSKCLHRQYYTGHPNQEHSLMNRIFVDAISVVGRLASSSKMEKSYSAANVVANVHFACFAVLKN